MNLENLFSQEELEAIEEMAYHGFTWDEISEVIPKRNLHYNPEHESYCAYRKGFLKSQLELRRAIFRDAKHGSSPAQAAAMKILDHAEYKMNNL